MKNRIVTSSPDGRQPPGALLEALRVIDPTIDLHYVGNGQWLLGSVRQNWQLDDNGRERRRTAHKLWEKEHRRWGIVRPEIMQMIHLMLHGFFEIAKYEIQGEPTSAIVRDLQVRDWNWRNNAEAVFEQNLDESEGLGDMRRRQAAARQFALDGAGDAYARAFRGRRTFASA